MPPTLHGNCFFCCCWAVGGVGVQCGGGSQVPKSDYIMLVISCPWTSAEVVYYTTSADDQGQVITNISHFLRIGPRPGQAFITLYKQAPQT